MKKNYVMRFAALLLVLVLLSTCVVSGTLAKYVTSGEAEDTATVAEWGVEVTVTGNDAFKTTYGTDNNDVKDDIQNSVVSASTINKLAPGTNGTLATLTIDGSPEVAANVKIVADLTLGDWETGSYEDEGTKTTFCPLVFTVQVNGGAAQEFKIDATNTTADLLAAAIEGAINFDQNYAPNATDLGRTITVTWAWAFDGNDANDTALGDLETLPTISFKLTATVTQID